MNGKNYNNENLNKILKSESQKELWKYKKLLQLKNQEYLKNKASK